VPRPSGGSFRQQCRKRVTREGIWPSRKFGRNPNRLGHHDLLSKAEISPGKVRAGGNTGPHHFCVMAGPLASGRGQAG